LAGTGGTTGLSWRKRKEAARGVTFNFRARRREREEKYIWGPNRKEKTKTTLKRRKEEEK